jgi:HprK-related kinase A
LKVSELSSAELRLQLMTSGIFMQTGAFTTHLRSSIPSVAAGIELLYADYPLARQADFADFHVSLERPRNLRGWLRAQVLFLFDGSEAFKPLPIDQAFPMLEWGLNWCISSHAHSYLMIHAAVVEKDGFAAILPAPPGSGKSTLCAGLVNRGWRLLSDELTLIRISDGKVVPVPRPVSLKNESINVIRRFVTNAVLSREVTDTIKGTIAHLKPSSDSVARASEVAQPAWIIFPQYQRDAAVRLEAVPRSRAFMRVADNAFNYSELGLKGFETMSRLIDATQSFDFTYSVLDEAIQIFGTLKPPHLFS